MSEQKPSVGRIVLYIQGDAELALEKYSGDHYSTFDELAKAGRHLPGTNGTRVHPALITRVWSDTCVNLHVFFDATPSVIKTSVTLIETPDDTHNPNAGWCWPPRV